MWVGLRGLTLISQNCVCGLGWMDGWMEGAEEAKRIFVDGVWVEMEIESVHSFSVYVCIHRAGVME